MTPDQTPALGWMAAREAAAEVAADYTPTKHGGAPLVAHVTGMNIKIAILALPAPTSAQLLAEALRLPEIAALVEAADRMAESTDALHLRALVAGWNGEHLETQYAPHPPRLGVTLKTNAGAVYELDAATTAYRATRGGV